MCVCLFAYVFVGGCVCACVCVCIFGVCVSVYIDVCVWVSSFCICVCASVSICVFLLVCLLDKTQFLYSKHWNLTSWVNRGGFLNLIYAYTSELPLAASIPPTPHTPPSKRLLYHTLAHRRCTPPFIPFVLLYLQLFVMQSPSERFLCGTWQDRNPGCSAPHMLYSQHSDKVTLLQLVNKM